MSEPKSEIKAKPDVIDVAAGLCAGAAAGTGTVWLIGQRYTAMEEGLTHLFSNVSLIENISGLGNPPQAIAIGASLVITLGSAGAACLGAFIYATRESAISRDNYTVDGKPARDIWPGPQPRR